MLKVVSPKKAKPEDVTIKQTGIKLEGGTNYIVKFDAYASKTTTILAKFAGKEEKVKIIPSSFDSRNSSNNGANKPNYLYC